MADNASKVIIGIDPGYAITGYGIIEKRRFLILVS